MMKLIFWLSVFLTSNIINDIFDLAKRDTIFFALYLVSAAFLAFLYVYRSNFESSIKIFAPIGFLIVHSIQIAISLGVSKLINVDLFTTYLFLTFSCSVAQPFINASRKSNSKKANT